MAINDLVVINTSVPHAETSQNGSPMEYVVLVQTQILLKVVVDVPAHLIALPEFF